MTGHPNSIDRPGLRGSIPSCFYVAASQVAEKVDLDCVLVAQALLPVRVLQSAHSQEWLCYPTFSATCETATLGFGFTEVARKLPENIHDSEIREEAQSA
jgi:hypothetical protein